MKPTGGRRAFLFGMTLNELAFILFFLLIIVSSAELLGKQNELQQQKQRIAALQGKLNRAQSEREQQFKKLVLLEQAMQTMGGLGNNLSAEELEQFFNRLQEIDQVERVMQSKQKLQEQLRRYQNITENLANFGQGDDSLETLEYIFAQRDSALTKEKNLHGQVAFLQNKLQQIKAGGRDYPPCWADAESGAIEYLYRIKLYEHRVIVEPAWPPGRRQEIRNITGAKALAGGSFQPEQFKQAAKPVLDWSRQHQCRHFVRIYDDTGISKQAFKNKLLMIENYFYKYLER